MAAEWEHAINAYEVLGLAQGPTATDAEISKVGPNTAETLSKMTY